MKAILTILLQLITICCISQGKKAAFLVSEGMLPLDYAGAYEVLAQARIKVFTVAKTQDTVRLSSNMMIIPNYSITKAPEFDILVIPVSFGDDSMMINWIKKRAANAEHILTICGGVTPVYDAGLLDGDTITSYGPLIDHLKEHAQKATVVSDKRFVDNGKIITCGSFVSGIDGALYLVSKMYGEPRAQEIANNIEYNWDKEYRFVRSNLADNWLSAFIDFGPPLTGKTLRYEGDEKKWEAEYEVIRRESFTDFYSQVPEMASMHHWKNLETKKGDNEYFSRWTRKDLNNRNWVCTVSIKKAGEENKYLISYKIQLEKQDW